MSLLYDVTDLEYAGILCGNTAVIKLQSHTKKYAFAVFNVHWKTTG